MVRLDDCGFSAKSRLYNVRIDGSLRKEINLSDLLCFFLEDTDKLFSDNLALPLRLGYACELAVITILRIDTDEVDVKRSVFTENAFHLIALILTKKAVVNKYTGQLLADRFGK